MNFLRNLSPRGKRFAVIGAAGVIGLVVLMSRRRAASTPVVATATPETTTVGAAGYGAGGTLPAGLTSDLPNAGYDSGASAGFSDLRDAIAGLGDRIDAIPLPSGASDIAQAIGAILTPGTDPAAPTTVTTAPPITESTTPASPVAPQPAPAAPRPAAATGPVGGRRVGPWATAAMRDKAVAGIPAGKVRKYSTGGKFYAEIFD